jgi:hypothetical protein
LTFWKSFSRSGSTDCTHALQQMENTWSEVKNGPLGYS